MDRPVISSGVRVARITSDEVPSLLLQRVARIRPRAGTAAEYIHRLLSGSGFQEYLTPIFTGISVPHLSPEQIRSFPIAVPLVHEQEAILRYVDSSIDRIGQVSARHQREIELIHEYRTRLISDVESGKLNMRGVDLGQLPEFEEIPEVDELSGPNDGVSPCG
jgi:type I restriction enzyme S subunit